jgi:hypothetical protein
LLTIASVEVTGSIVVIGFERGIWIMQPGPARLKSSAKVTKWIPNPTHPEGSVSA